MMFVLSQLLINFDYVNVCMLQINTVHSIELHHTLQPLRKIKFCIILFYLILVGHMVHDLRLWECHKWQHEGIVPLTFHCVCAHALQILHDNILIAA